MNANTSTRTSIVLVVRRLLTGTSVSTSTRLHYASHKLIRVEIVTVKSIILLPVRTVCDADNKPTFYQQTLQVPYEYEYEYEYECATHDTTRYYSKNTTTSFVYFVRRAHVIILLLFLEFVYLFCISKSLRGATKRGTIR